MQLGHQSLKTTEQSYATQDAKAAAKSRRVGPALRGIRQPARGQKSLFDKFGG